MGSRAGAAVLFLGLLAIAPAHAQQAPAAARAADNPFAPYEFLIGEWDTGDGVVQRFRWGPEHAYILYSLPSEMAMAASTCISKASSFTTPRTGISIS